MLALVNDHSQVDDPGRRAIQVLATHIEELDSLSRNNREIAVLQVADHIGQRRERDCVGAKEHLTMPVANGKRGPFSGADQEIVVPLEQECERERSF